MTINGIWKYTLAAMAQEESGVLIVEEYIRRRQNTVAHYIATRSLLYLCEGLERAPRTQVGMQWIEQVGIDLTVLLEAAAAAKKGDEG